MARYRGAHNAGQSRSLREWWIEHSVVLEEILVSELLVRVVAAISNEILRMADPTDDKSVRSSHESLAAVTHGVFLSQTEASNRVAQLILEGHGARVQDTVRLNRLRYGVERWTDWLIGRISLDANRSFEYCIDLERAQSFHTEVRQRSADLEPDITTRLMRAAMRDMLTRRTSSESALPHANQQVASSALALFRPELFDDYGVPKSLWLRRLQDTPIQERSPSKVISREPKRSAPL
ncbi:hypothetical protein NHH03_12300 [Stieleria sp. TO1_6]|uniref:hypothetical protein n=1 Tax=Stieleria tagensis TaxID=2956795 RepID=UPI00209A7F2C|nr:hypothetical protein [Stieleria tagensis]MCO8122521.1 hypothetical protein [Stieleria tagensis]